jgi:hypothetical protein
MMDNDGVDVEFGNRWRLDRRGMFRATTSAEGDGTLVKKNGVATAGNRKEEDSVVARRERERERGKRREERPAGRPPSRDSATICTPIIFLRRRIQASRQASMSHNKGGEGASSENF